MKIDSNGNEEWNMTYDVFITSVQKTYDNGFILTGLKLGYIDGFTVIRTDNSGDIIWEEVFGEGSNYDDYISFDINQTIDGGFVIIGAKGLEIGFHDWDYDLWLVKTDEYGEMQWNLTYEGDSYTIGHSVRQTNDGGYILTGGMGNLSLIKIKRSYEDIVVDSISGGFHINMDIKNNGNATAYNVPWSIELHGGLIMVGGHSYGTINNLNPGEETIIRQKFLFGIGYNVEITINAGDSTKKANANWILGPLVIGVTDIT
jgi:hypothetical protein